MGKISASVAVAKSVGKLADRIRVSHLPPLDLNAMTVEERRVAIALDVLALLDARRLAPTRVIYINAYDFGADVYEADAKELRRLLDTPPRTCEVCAMGASLVSFVRLFNQVCGNDFDYEGIKKVRAAIGEEFSWSFEYAFQGSSGWRDTSRVAWESRRDSGRRRSARSRLRQLMAAIVETAGSFEAFRDRFWMRVEEPGEQAGGK